MVWQKNKYVLLFLTLLIWPLQVDAQHEQQESYFQEDIRPNPNESEWRKATEGINFGEPQPKEEQEQEAPEEAPSTGGSSFFANSQLAQIILFSLAALLLAYILIRLFWGNKLFVSNKKINRRRGYSSGEEAEADAPISELERFLADAKAKGEWQLAVRLYFLMILGELSEKRLIHWKKDKTNRQYLNEMGSGAPELASTFRQLAAFYEWVWYGKKNLTATEFEEAERHFNIFLNSIRGKRIAA